MQKIKKFLLIFITSCFIMIAYLSYTSKEKNISPLQLNNIEALASGEGVTEFMCYGNGLVDCPTGDKVKYFIDNLSLDLD